MSEVSDEAIAREVRTLRTLRRRSGSGTGPGALAIDPDLPPPSPTSHQPYPAEASTSFSSDDDVTLAPALGGDSFWVPAHLHPELAPGEFRAFLKSHTSAHPEDAEVDQNEALGRSPSWLARRDSRRASDLGRKRSMLSRQYTPKVGDDVENERPPLPLRQRASIYGGSSGEKGLTLEDLQKLEMLVEEAAESDDPAAMTKLLKRNLSVNAQSGFLQDDIPVEGTGGAALPRPSSILRRSAHTKIRKAGLAGDGGGHRFAATRKGRTTAAPVIDIPGLEDDDEYGGPSRRRAVTPSDESEESGSSRRKASSSDSHEQIVESRRPSDGSTDETTIFDAYARNSRQSSISNDSSSRSESPSPEPSPPRQNANLPPILEIPKSTSGSFEWYKEEGEKTPTQESPSDPLSGYRRPSPGEGFSEARPSAHLPPSLNLESPVERRVSPPDQTTPKAAHHDLPPGMAAPSRHSTQGVPVQPQGSERPSMNRTDSVASASSASSASREKEKKGGLFSKKEKKGSKKEKDSFLGSLFGGNKKKQEEPIPVSNFSQAGPAAAAALLGASKSNKSLTPGASPTSPSFNSFARYPIHVERAVYRLSHIKLANARRPLYEQVLISNLMFWYLGVIGRNVAEEKKANAEEEKAQAKPPVSKGTPPRSIDSGIAGVAPVRTPEPPVVSPTPAPGSGKKTGLTKPDRSRQPGRDAEAPVRTPSYGMQTAQVDNEVRTANMAMASMGLKGPPRPPSMPPQSHQQHQSPHQHSSPSPPMPHSPHRANSQPPPQQHRTMSPPGPPQPRPASDYGSGPAKPLSPPVGQSQPQRGPPPAQPTFYGQAQPNGMSSSHSMSDMRDGRQRPHSNPAQAPYPSQHASNPNGQPPPPQMRRVVSEARSPPPPQHSGPQPGQIFRLPQAQAPPPASPYGPRQSLGSPPLPPAGRGYPGPPPQPRPPQGQPGPGQQPPPHGYRGPPAQPPTFANGARPSVPWEPPQRLPPGASPPPSGTVPYRPAQHMQHPQGQRSPPASQYDGRHHSPPLAGYPQSNGMPPGMQPSYSAHPQAMRPPGPPRPGSGPAPGFNPYGQAVPGPQRQRSGDEGMYHRPAQAVPQGYGGHHR